MMVLDVRVWYPNPDPKRAWEGSRAVVRALGLGIGYKKP